MDVDACAVLENDVISTRRLGQRENRKLPNREFSIVRSLVNEDV